MSDLNHPAIKANMQSTELAQAGDKDAWLALYANDALLKDDQDNVYSLLTDYKFNTNDDLLYSMYYNIIKISVNLMWSE